MKRKDDRFYWLSAILLSAAGTLIAFGLLIFAVGFFPYKPYISGHAVFDNDEGEGASPAAPFDKVILMVVDALRSDFVYSPESGFSFLQSLIQSGEALPFTANANPPTITMPKIKAITTGSVPSFLDVILNFAESDTSSSLATQDTWLAQLRRKDNGKLIMFGDDTWLKLFPGFFARSDGTTSFFVSDFTEVDNNVTRNIPRELEQSDWNGMILHYLGLDHIGHKSGPHSFNMRPKQVEMDGIIRTITESIRSNDHLMSTLLVLCGDHGMNEGGNHGGAGEGETSPALVFISPKLATVSSGSPSPLLSPSSGTYGYYESVEQSDIAPTLAALLGFPIPLNNLGVLIRQTLGFWREEQQIHLMHQNARQILRIAERTFPQMDLLSYKDDTLCKNTWLDELQLSCLWSKATVNTDKIAHESKLDAYQEFCRRAQRILSSTASNYDVSKLGLGIGLALISTALLLIVTLSDPLAFRPSDALFGTIIVAWSSMMFASSYVEEEHHFWYWTTSAWMMWGVVKYQRRLGRPSYANGVAFLPFLVLRMTRSWNQTGQKYAGAPDIAKHLLPAHRSFLWLLIALTYALTAIQLSRSALPGFPRWAATSISILVGFLSFAFKVTFTLTDAPELLAGYEPWIPQMIRDASLVSQARVVFALTFMLALGTLSRVLNWSVQQNWLRALQSSTFPMMSMGYRGLNLGAMSSAHEIITVFLLTQTRAVNIPLFLLFSLQLSVMKLAKLSPKEVMITSLLFQNVAFNALGGSNAISSIDLSNAYNGVSGYSVGAVGLLTFVGNWAGPIWWSSATHAILLEEDGRQDAHLFFRSLSYSMISSSVSCLGVMMACAALRSHLFIWTVFSPKYLYALAWFFGQQICVNVGLGTLLYKLRQKLQILR